METNYNVEVKEKYSGQLIENGETEKARRILVNGEYAPIFSMSEMHPESEIKNSEINTMFNEIALDIDIVNTQFNEATKRLNNLIQSTTAKLDNIKSVLKTEKERCEDMNILCNKYADFSNIMLISDKNAAGNNVYEDGVFHIGSKASSDVSYEVLNITGNGYEGNEYVYKNDGFYNKVSDTSNRKYINDNSIITYYEYSRISASNTETSIPPHVNFDSIYARCSVLLRASDAVNTLQLESDTNDTIIESLSVSLDGTTFYETDIKNVAVNNKKDRYRNDDYIYGSGILSFKDCTYIKIVLKANSYTDDDIAFIKKGEDNQDMLVKLKTARRSVIKINDITLSRKTYPTSGKIVVNNFISSPVSSIAIFAKEYCADELNLRESIKYTLTVNGLDYEMIPINSNYNGKKVIRTTSETLPADYVHYITETIKNATLTIDLNTNKKYATPFISDLKLLIGGE